MGGIQIFSVFSIYWWEAGFFMSPFLMSLLFLYDKIRGASWKFSKFEMEKAELKNSFGQNVVDLAKRYTSEHSLDYFALFGCFCVSRYCSGGFYK